MRRKNVHRWLKFLIQFSPAYEGVSINSEQLQSLPDDGCVAERVLTQIEEEVEEEAPVSSEKDASEEPNVIEESSDSDEDLEEEEKNMGPDQGGATGDVGHVNNQMVVEHFLFTPPDKPSGTLHLAPEDEQISFFGKKSPLKANWIWFCIEYQGRGSAHGHGCCRLACDPGIVQLAEKLLKGRQALHLIQNQDPNGWKEKYPFFRMSHNFMTNRMMSGFQKQNLMTLGLS